jgi:hypothetical protein
MHREILKLAGIEPSKNTDHKNGSGLDNRLNNLRRATYSENRQNSRLCNKNTSGFRGVDYHKYQKKWAARIGANGTRRCIGYFDSAEEAGAAYDLAAKELHGEFARLNFNSPPPAVATVTSGRGGLLTTTTRNKNMHYRNGREAKNGDKIVQLGNDGQITAAGVLHSAAPGNDYCNGVIAPIQEARTGACMCDCLHVDDVAALLKEKGLDKRPAGK